MYGNLPLAPIRSSRHQTSVLYSRTSFVLVAVLWVGGGLVLVLSVAVGFRVSGGFSSGIRFGFEISVGFGTSGILLVPSNKFV